MITIGLGKNLRKKKDEKTPSSISSIPTSLEDC